MSVTVECPGCHVKIQVPASSAGKRGKCKSCGAEVVVPSKAAKRCVDCGVDVSTAKRIKDSNGNYLCEQCSADRLVAEMGIEPTNAAHQVVTPDAVDARCGRCGKTIAGSSTFCAHCGTKQYGTVSPTEAITLASLIADLAEYGKFSMALDGMIKCGTRLHEELAQATAMNDVARAQQIGVAYQEALEAGRRCGENCQPVLVRLRAADRLQLQKYRQLVIDNPSVPDEVKQGLSADVYEVFTGNSSAALPLSTVARPAASAKKLSAVRASPAAGIALAVFLLSVIALLISVLGFFAVVTSDSSDGQAGGLVVSFFVGIGAFVVAFMSWFCLTNACPKCRRLFTGETVKAEALGGHIENRRQVSTAEHFNNVGRRYGTSAYETTRAVAVDTFLLTNVCRVCGHAWCKKERKDRV